MPPAPPIQAAPSSSALPNIHLPRIAQNYPSQSTGRSGVTPQGDQRSNQSPQIDNGQPRIPQSPLTSNNLGQPAGPQAQFPPHLQQTFNQFQVIQQQLAAQLASLNNHPIIQGQTVEQGGQIRQSHIQIPQEAQQPPFQHVFPQQQQQQQPPPPPQPQPSGPGGPPHSHSPLPQQQIHGQTVRHSNNNHLPPNLGQVAGSPNVNTLIREHIGPNGQRWSTVTHFGTMSVANPFSHAHEHPVPTQGGNALPRSSTPNNGNPQSTPATSNPAPIERAQSPSAGPNQSYSNHTFMATPTTSHADTDGTSMLRAAEDRAASQRGALGADSSSVYVLSSPSGPQALLVAPSGNYTAQWPLPDAPPFINLTHLTPVPSNRNRFMPNPGLRQTNVAPPVMQPGQGQAANTGQAQNATQLAQTQPQAPVRPHPVAVAEVNQQQHQHQQQEQQARVLARVVMPLGGHLWLFIRLFGFVYFFTHGASWSRTLFLIAIATLVFIGQTGVFRPFVQGFWDPIRRHADDLVPLANNDRPREDNGRTTQNSFRATSTPGSTHEPTPEEAAHRLLERRNHENIIRQSFRRVERAIALFVASLVPGVGERHIAVREAAEAARQAEVREREERLRREEEETGHEQEGTLAAGAAVTEAAGEGPSERSQTSASGEQAGVGQPPLVEV